MKFEWTYVVFISGGIHFPKNRSDWSPKDDFFIYTAWLCSSSKECRRVKNVKLKCLKRVFEDILALLKGLSERLNALPVSSRAENSETPETTSSSHTYGSLQATPRIPAAAQPSVRGAVLPPSHNNTTNIARDNYPLMCNERSGNVLYKTPAAPPFG